MSSYARPPPWFNHKDAALKHSLSPGSYLTNIMKTKDWLLLNAVECWLHHYSGKGEHTSQYITLRDELRLTLELKDAGEPVSASSQSSSPSPRKPTRKRSSSTQSKKDDA